MRHETIIILDFGGQYNQLIGRRIRDLGVYCEVLPYKTSIEKIKEKSPVGIIFTGGPASVYEENAPICSKDIFNLGVPILGICYGNQLITQIFGGEVSSAKTGEYGRAKISYEKSTIFDNIPNGICWMSHADKVTKLPAGFVCTAKTDDCEYAAIENAEKKLYGVQFHPEVSHTENGSQILKNFLFNICGVKGDWKMSDFAEEMVAEIRKKAGDSKVLCALSGGVDSSVAAALVSRAIGNNLTCIFVDHGLMRKNEGDDVEKVFKDKNLNFIRVNAGEIFLGKLKGITDPEKKRKIIGEEFIRTFESEAKKIGKIDYLVQGTIYPDIIESGTENAAVIKSHHNVGGLPEHMDFKGLIEPLRLLFKDEVRNLGRELGLPETLVSRQPFPGPGLAVRVIGEITEAKLSVLREADAIFREEIMAAGLDGKTNQYFAILTDMKSVGVMGDSRTYEYTLALRAVCTTDFMTATWFKIPYETLDKVSTRIVNEVPHINRIVYDITDKPPATIEWE